MSQTPVIPIRDRRIGDDHPVYIIAELGVNHDGSPERALALTRAAKEAGADGVKLQLFQPDLLLSAQAILADYQKSQAQDVHDMLARLTLPLEAVAAVRDLAHELEMGFVLTCFSIELADQVRQLEPDAVKVASPDAVNLPLLRALLPLEKPMLISTGTCELEEIAPAVELCRNHPTALLQCVSAYPPPIGQAALGGIAAIRERFGLTTGYSDHTTGILTGMLSVAVGAKVIEKHLTYDNNAAGPDHTASLDPWYFHQYVIAIRAAEIEVGPRTKRVMPCEQDVRKVSRQSVCATRDLPAGHTLTRQDLTVKRPGTGIPAARLESLFGRSLQRPVQANHLLQDDDLAS